MDNRPSLTLLDSTKLRRLYGFACLMDSLAGRLEDRADRQERGLPLGRYLQDNNEARKVIAGLRSQAACARADKAAAWAGIDELSMQRSSAS